MAKKKEEVAAPAEAAKEAVKDATSVIVNKKYGKGLFVKGSDLIDNPKRIISISPRIDLLLNGGIRETDWISIIGPPKIGKTVLALRMAERCQKQGFFVLYANIENRLKAMNLKGTRGLIWDDEDKLMVLQSRKDKILNGEEYLDIMETKLKNSDNVFLIADSFSSLAHPKQVEQGVGTHTRGGMGVLTSQFINNISPVVQARGHIIVNILQQYCNTSGFGGPRNVSGGSKVIYQSDTTIEARKKVELKSGEKIFGQSVTWEIDCSSLGGFPGSKVDSYIKYGHGIYAEMELIDMAKEVGIIEVSGSWLQYGEEKYQGMANFAKVLEEDETLYNEIYEKVMETYKALREEA